MLFRSESIISKKSSPHLWSGHLAEDEIGASYEEIDCILYCLLEKKMSLEEINQETSISNEKILKIQQLYKNSEHKRIIHKGL